MAASCSNFWQLAAAGPIGVCFVAHLCAFLRWLWWQETGNENAAAFAARAGPAEQREDDYVRSRKAWRTAAIRRSFGFWLAICVACLAGGGRYGDAGAAASASDHQVRAAERDGRSAPHRDHRHRHAK